MNATNPDASHGRRFYRTVLVVEVLGTEPYTDGLAGLSYAVGEGDFSGDVLAENTHEVGAAEMAALLVTQGSAPDFLSVDDDWGTHPQESGHVSTQV